MRDTVRDTWGGDSGALFLWTSTSLVTNCTFARLEGKFSAAISVYLGSTVVVESSLFHDNFAREANTIGTCAFSSNFFSPTNAAASKSLSRAQTLTRT